MKLFSSSLRVPRLVSCGCELDRLLALADLVSAEPPPGMRTVLVERGLWDLSCLGRCVSTGLDLPSFRI